MYFSLPNRHCASYTIAQKFFFPKSSFHLHEMHHRPNFKKAAFKGYFFSFRDCGRSDRFLHSNATRLNFWQQKIQWKLLHCMPTLEVFVKSPSYPIFVCYIVLCEPCAFCCGTNLRVWWQFTKDLLRLSLLLTMLEITYPYKRSFALRMPSASGKVIKKLSAPEKTRATKS